MDNEDQTTDENQAAPEALLPLATGHRRNGKVAKKPKAVRDQINHWLTDGLTYSSIIEKLGDDGKDLNEENLSNWKEGGYNDWLKEQQRIEIIRIKQEFAVDLLKDGDGTKIQEAALQVSAANLIQLMVDLDPTTLREQVEGNPDKYTRLLNAIARLSEGEIKCERHRSQETERQVRVAKDKAAAQKQGGISDEAFEKAEEKLNLM